MQEKKTGIEGQIPATFPKQWVANYADYLYNYAISRINDNELARDLVQDTFLAALERLNSFEGRSTERTWLTAILKNKIIDVYRKRSSGLANKESENYVNDDKEGFFDADDGHWQKRSDQRNLRAVPMIRFFQKSFMSNSGNVWISCRLYGYPFLR